MTGRQESINFLLFDGFPDQQREERRRRWETVRPRACV